MSTQRTGIFGAATHIRPGVAPEERLQALLHKVGAHIQEATNDGRAYTIEIKVTTYLTVEPWEAEIGEHVHRDHFQDAEPGSQVLAIPSTSTEKRAFEPTRLGYQRIE